MSRKRGVKNTTSSFGGDFLEEKCIVSIHDLPPPSESNGKLTLSRRPRKSNYTNGGQEKGFRESTRENLFPVTKEQEKGFRGPREQSDEESFHSSSEFDPTPRTEIVPLSEFQTLAKNVERLRKVVEKIQEEILALGDRMRAIEETQVCSIPDQESPELVPINNSDEESEEAP